MFTLPVACKGQVLNVNVIGMDFLTKAEALVNGKHNKCTLSF